MHTNISSGRYLISPLTRKLDDGSFAASVSIRSGQGQSTHDRVMRFSMPFMSSAAAACYALNQGLGWVKSHGVAGSVPLVA